MNTPGYTHVVMLPCENPKCKGIQNRASGMFRVTVRKFKRLETLHLALCAECAFTTIPNRRRMASVKRPDGEEDLIFFRDVEKVELIRTL